MTDQTRRIEAVQNPEPEPQQKKIALIVEDNRMVAKGWEVIFRMIPNLEIVALDTQKLSELPEIDLTHVVVAIVDQFVVKEDLRPSVQKIIDNLREKNKSAFIIETSMLDPLGFKSYNGSNATTSSAPQNLVSLREKIEEEKIKRPEDGIFMLEKAMVPAMHEANRLDSGGKPISENLLINYYWEKLKQQKSFSLVLEKTGVSQNEFESGLKKINPDQKRILLHCAFLVAAHLEEGRSEEYWSLSASRIRTLLGISS